VTAAQYKELETRLAAAEELFFGRFIFGAKTIEIRDQLRRFLIEVVVKRMMDRYDCRGCWRANGR